MPNFIIRRVETLEVFAATREEAAKIAQSGTTAIEELSVDYYYDAPCETDISDIYELAPWQ